MACRRCMYQWAMLLGLEPGFCDGEGHYADRLQHKLQLISPPSQIAIAARDEDEPFRQDRKL
jgi:hypothetical protein